MNIRQTLVATAGALIALTLAVGTSARADTVLTYTFDPGSTFNFGDGNEYAAVGSFTLDVTTSTVTLQTTVRSKSVAGLSDRSISQQQ